MMLRSLGRLSLGLFLGFRLRLRGKRRLSSFLLGSVDMLGRCASPRVLRTNEKLDGVEFRILDVRGVNLLGLASIHASKKDLWFACGVSDNE